MKKWLNAFRLKTLPLSLSSIIMGSFLAKYEGYFSLLIFGFATITTIFLQILSNLANDYGDFVKGADNDDRLGPMRALQSGSISKQTMKKAIIICSALSLISGLSLLFIAFGIHNIQYIISFLAIGLIAIWAAINYTAGENPYGYKAMGDVFVFLFFGLVGVCGTYFLYTKTFNWDVVLPAITSGLLATGVLNINNIRDIQSDSKVGKKTIPVLIGKKNAVLYHTFILFGSFLSMLSWSFLNLENYIYTIAFLPFFIFLIFPIWKNKKPTELNNQLRNLSLFSLIITISFGTYILYCK